MNKEYVKVPINELRKLEEARLKLYDWLISLGLSDAQIHYAFCFTGQIWKVANTREWEIDISRKFHSQKDLLNYLMHGGTLVQIQSDNVQKDRVKLHQGNLIYVATGHSADDCLLSPRFWQKEIMEK